jgi:hypothetical protein
MRCLEQLSVVGNDCTKQGVANIFFVKGWRNGRRISFSGDDSVKFKLCHNKLSILPQPVLSNCVFQISIGASSNLVPCSKFPKGISSAGSYSGRTD